MGRLLFTLIILHILQLMLHTIYYYMHRLGELLYLPVLLLAPLARIQHHQGVGGAPGS